MSSTAKVWIDQNTRVICQGFTGKQVRIRIYTAMVAASSHVRIRNLILSLSFTRAHFIPHKRSSTARKWSAA